MLGESHPPQGCIRFSLPQLEPGLLGEPWDSLGGPEGQKTFLLRGGGLERPPVMHSRQHPRGRL